MRYKYRIVVDEGQYTGAEFIFYNIIELIDFIKTCLCTNVERKLEINKEVVPEENNGRK